MAKYLFGEQESCTPSAATRDAERKNADFSAGLSDEASLYGEDSPLRVSARRVLSGGQPKPPGLSGGADGRGRWPGDGGRHLRGQGQLRLFRHGGDCPYLLQTFISAGRTKLHLEPDSPFGRPSPEPEIKEIRDTLASLRLDSVVSSGFRIGRSLAAQYVSAGKAAIDGLPCEKPDKSVPEGAKISVRGLGKSSLRPSTVGQKRTEFRWSSTGMCEVLQKT